MPNFSMSSTVLKNLFKKPATVRYPFETKELVPQTRGSIRYDVSQCIFCGMCQKKCPTGAITMFKEEKKFTVKRQNCIVCGYCVEVCPKKCIYMDAVYSKPFLTKGEDVFV